MVAPEVEECTHAGQSPHELATINAARKSFTTSANCLGKVVLGADTIVVLDDVVFGKPKDVAEARQMLQRLSGKMHEVITAVCISQQGEKNSVPPKSAQFAEVTKVYFREVNDAEIDAYLSRVYVLDKAGAYAAQEDEGQLIHHFEGDMDTVIGLPIMRVKQELTTHFPELLERRDHHKSES